MYIDGFLCLHPITKADKTWNSPAEVTDILCLYFCVLTTVLIVELSNTPHCMPVFTKRGCLFAALSYLLVL